MNSNIRTCLRYLYQRLLEQRLRKQYDNRFVLMFHQIEDEAERWYDSRYALSFSKFVKVIEEVQNEGYIFVSPYDLIERDYLKKVTLTFDDVFEGVYKYVYPYLRERDIPFVIFPAINRLNEKGYINQEMLVEMSNEYEGCFVGGHGITHTNLRNMSREQCEEEMRKSRIMLEEMIGKSVDLFAYPFGDINAVGKRERKIARENYFLSFGTLQVGMPCNFDRTYIPRVNIGESDYCIEFVKSVLGID